SDLRSLLHVGRVSPGLGSDVTYIHGCIATGFSGIREPRATESSFGVAPREIQLYQLSGLGSGVAEAGGICHVKHEIAFATGSKRAHEKGLPSAAVLDVSGHGRAIDKILVLV